MLFFSLNSFSQDIVKTYYPDCSECILSEYQKNENNELDGYYIYYYKSGKIKEKRMYKNGELIDYIKKFYSNGNLNYHLIFYHDNKQKGYISFFHSNGKILSYGKFENFEEKVIDYELEQYGEFLYMYRLVYLARKVGLWYYYDRDGQLIEVESYESSCFPKKQIEFLGSPLGDWSFSRDIE